MWKRLSVAIVAFLALTAQALGAGSISLSLSQQFDAQGRPLAGGLFYTFVTGTTTPQNAFQDTSLTIPFPNPIVLDASGRLPPFYLADGTIKIRLTNSSGVTVIAADGLLVVGPSSGGGGGGSVDATAILATGDTKARYGTGTISGFVRANGRTLGSATSGATERANADAQALFEYLWTTDANLTVSTGRGATANADWLANKTITLPDMRGRVMAGMDDMGATAAARLNIFGATVLGAAGGAQTNTLTTSTQLPAHTHTVTPTGSVSVLSTSSAHSHAGVENSHTHIYDRPNFNTINVTLGGSGIQSFSSFSPTATGSQSDAGVNVGSDGAHVHDATFTGTSNIATSSVGASAAFNTTQPTMVVTFYMKL
jgi:microcystin-dependent protein